MREMEQRFTAADQRFEALQREMGLLREVFDRRFRQLQWILSLWLGLLAGLLGLLSYLRL